MPLTPQQINIALQGVSKWLGKSLNPQEVQGFTKVIQQNPSFYDYVGKAAAPLQKAVGSSALPLIGAGALATGAWAYPAKKLGEEIGWRIEEKREGKRLRPPPVPFKEYAKYLPEEIAKTVTAPARWVGRGIMNAIKKRIKKK